MTELDPGWLDRAAKRAEEFIMAAPEHALGPAARRLRRSLEATDAP